MGASATKVQQNNKISHERLGILELVFQSNEDAVKDEKVKMHCQLQSETQFKMWQKDILKINNSDAKEILYLPISYNFQKQGFCGSAGVLNMELQYYQYTLKSQITSRFHSKSFFQETELWYILYGMIQAGYIYEEINERLGDFHPNNILINNKGRMKVVPTCLIPRTLTNFQKIVESKINDAFLAPQEIDEELIEKGIYPNNIDRSKAETFCIGVTTLMAATLENCYLLYDRKKLGLNSIKLRQLQKDVANRYSSYFVSTLESLLEELPKRRIKCSELFKELHQYQEEILSLREFNRKLNDLNISNSQEFQTSIVNFLPKNVESTIQANNNINRPKFNSY